MRIGQGYDIHRMEEGRKLLLGAVEIPSSKGELAHSDGDVLLHALIDAILGAYALGDIGMAYPDTEERTKDMPSAVMLKEVLRDTKVKLINIDATIFLERPKLLPYKKSISESLSRLTGLPVDAICVKAKTAEGLGPVGEGKAIAAAVTVLVE